MTKCGINFVSAYETYLLVGGKHYDIKYSINNVLLKSNFNQHTVYNEWLIQCLAWKSNFIIIKLFFLKCLVHCGVPNLVKTFFNENLKCVISFWLNIKKKIEIEAFLKVYFK